MPNKKLMRKNKNIPKRKSKSRSLRKIKKKSRSNQEVKKSRKRKSKHNKKLRGGAQEGNTSNVITGRKYLNQECEGIDKRLFRIMYFKNLIELLEIKREETLPSEELLDLPNCIFLYLKKINKKVDPETPKQQIEIPEDFLTKNVNLKDDNSEDVKDYFRQEIVAIKEYIKNTIIIISRGKLENKNERKLLLNFIKNEIPSYNILNPTLLNIDDYVSIHINRYDFETIFVNISKEQLKINLNNFKETTNDYDDIVVDDKFIDKKIYSCL